MAEQEKGKYLELFVIPSAINSSKKGRCLGDTDVGPITPRLSRKRKVVTNYSVFCYLSIFTNTINMNYFLRGFISCCCESKELACVCTCQICYDNNHITLCNDCLYLSSKIRKTTSYALTSSINALGPLSCALAVISKILWTYELRYIAYISYINDR
jgi:hypothetical protein